MYLANTQSDDILFAAKVGMNLRNGKFVEAPSDGRLLAQSKESDEKDGDKGDSAQQEL